MQLTQLLAGVPYTLAHGTLHLEIGDLVYDSRKVTPGCVFVCLSGARVDGHSFAAQAAQNGAAAVVAQKEVDCPGATLVLTKDTRYALGLHVCRMVWPSRPKANHRGHHRHQG